MSFKEHSFICALLLGVGLLLPAGVAAQDNFEIQVYGAKTVEPGKTMVELHSNITVRGTTHKVKGVLPTEHALHETLEITHGFTPWFETGFYLFTSVQPKTGWEWVGDHIRPRLRIPESWHWPIGVSLSTELGYQRRAFSTDTWTWEIRPIIDQQQGRWYWSFNPVLERTLKGENVKRGFEFSPNFKLSYDITPTVSGGLEYYGALGPLTGFDRLTEQQHQLFPVVDLNLGPQWECNAGVGIGLTRSTDPLLVKLILGYRFGFGSPGGW
jgi:hypothetical protein